MGKTRDLFKKIRDTKGTFHAKMGTIKDINGISSVKLLSHVRLIAAQWTAAHQVSLSITNSWSLFKLKSTELVMPSSHHHHLHHHNNYPTVPFYSCLQAFPASWSFQMSQFFASGDPSIGVSVSASVLPVNIQDWFPLGGTGWLSLLSMGLSIVFSNTTVQKHQFFGTQLSL